MPTVRTSALPVDRAIGKSTQPKSPISKQPISAAWTFGTKPLTISTISSPRIVSACGARRAAGRSFSSSTDMFSTTTSSMWDWRSCMSDQKPVSRRISPIFNVSSSRACKTTLLPCRNPMTGRPYSKRIRASKLHVDSATSLCHWSFP